MARHGVLYGLLAAAAAALAAGGCTSILGNFSSSDVTPGGDASTSQKGDGSTSDAAPGDGQAPGSGDASGDGPSVALGTPCASAATCAPGQSCTDGVCCESACDGVCEACNVQGMVGHCEPIPANTDPDNECRPVVVASDAGAASDGGAGDGGATEADGGVADAMADDGGGGTSIQFPEGGVVVEQSTCAGTCNGQRACQYPGSTTRCGTEFCASPTSTASFECNGQGSCELTPAGCGGYTCESTPDAGAQNVGACLTTCTLVSDCDDSSYCDGQHCQPLRGDGVPCQGGNQCGSGYCIGSVCCNTACDPTLGLTCMNPRSPGTCTCTLDCGDAAACELFYPDVDRDGYGDESATPTVACSDSPPSGSYTLDHSDCDDGDANVHPGQTAWFTTSSHGTGTYDYNCDGTNEAEYAVYSGGSCQYCSGSVGSCTSGTCATTGTQTYLTCAGEHSYSGICELEETDKVTVDLAIGPIGPPILLCEACGAGTAGFVTNVSCGQAGTYATCGTCATAGTYGTAVESTSSVTQGCH